MQIQNTQQLVSDILAGKRLKRSDDLGSLTELPLEGLLDAAGAVQRHFRGKRINLCTIINARSGRCSEDCKYCAQAARHATGIDEYSFLPQEEIIANARANEQAGANRLALVTSGRALGGKEFEQAIAAYRELAHKTKLDLCASHGLLTQAQMHALHEAGVTRYHHNIETSRRFFAHICTTHSYDDRIRTIKLAQAEGLAVCSGGILGLGENWDDRLDMAVSLSELGIDSIPLNVLMPIPGTPLEENPPLPPEDILRTIAIFRLLNPEADIRLAAGRKRLPKNGETAFLHGASASITGNMLTTSGTTIAEDVEMLKRLGLTNQP